MKTDRELLELAAKAAGYKTEKYEKERGVLAQIYGDCLWSFWNPLTDDGEALRLAVKLELSAFVSIVCRGRSKNKKWNVYSPDSGYDKGEASEVFGIDTCASYRRAIVRAAAAIGEGME